MPVASQVGVQLGHDDEVSFAHFDRTVTAGTDVLLAGGIRLDRCDGLYPERAAHSTRATVSRIAPATKAKSTTVFRCWRKGLKPMSES